MPQPHNFRTFLYLLKFVNSRLWEIKGVDLNALQPAILFICVILKGYYIPNWNFYDLIIGYTKLYISQKLYSIQYPHFFI